jgi:DNA-binding MarR family transcriptional regulator
MTVQAAAHTRRENVVALTPAGTALVRKGDALTEDSRRAMLDAVNPDELETAVRVLRALLQTMEP